MSIAGEVGQIHQEEEDLHNELATANQLLRLISMELDEIKEMTSPGGGLESAIKQNAAVVRTLANLQQIDINNLPPIQRNPAILGMSSNQNA